MAEIALMPLSHSRIEGFKKCPFSFKKRYIEKVKSGSKSDPLRVGSCVHEILEEVERHCLETTMINQFNASKLAGNVKIPGPMGAFIKSKYGQISRETYVRTIFNFPSIMSTMMNVIDFYKELDKTSGFEIIENVPFLGEFCQNIVNKKMAEHTIDSDRLRNDVVNMSERAITNGTFVRFHGEIVFLESQMAFNPSWNPVDWMDPMVAFRGKADKIIFNFNERFISVIDYKTSRSAMSVAEAGRDNQLKLYLMFMRKQYKTEFEVIRVVWDYVRLGKKVELSFSGQDIDRIAGMAEDYVIENRQKINDAIKNNDFPCKINEYCDDCEFRCSECSIFGGKVSTDIEKPNLFVIKNAEDAKNVYVFVQALRYKADMLNAKLKKYVDSQTGEVPIADGMKLGYIEDTDREFNTLKTHALLLEKKVSPEIIYKYTTITRANFEKLLLKAKIILSEDELNSISKVKSSSKFGVIS